MNLKDMNLKAMILKDMNLKVVKGAKYKQPEQMKNMELSSKHETIE